MTLVRVIAVFFFATMVLFHPIGSARAAAARLQDFAATGNQHSVAKTLDAIGPATPCGSTLCADYNRLLLNGVDGSPQVLQSLLPTSSFESSGIVRNSITSTSLSIMPHMRSLRANVTDNVVDISALRMANLAESGTINPPTGYSLDKASPSRHEGRMYSPSLYGTGAPAEPLVVISEPTGRDTRSAPTLDITPTRKSEPLQGIATVPSVTTYEAAPVPTPSSRSNVIVLDGSQPARSAPSTEPYPGQPPLVTASSSVPAYRPPASSRQAERDEGDFWDWLSDVFCGPDADETPRRVVQPRVIAPGNRDHFYIKAMQNYPGQPFAKYAQHVLNTGISAVPQSRDRTSSTSVNIPLSNAYGFVFVDTTKKPLTFSDEDVIEAAISESEAALSLPTQRAAKTTATKSYVVAEATMTNDVPKNLGMIAIPLNENTSPKPLSSVRVPQRLGTIAIPLNKSAAQEPIIIDQVPSRLGTTAIPFRRAKPEQPALSSATVRPSPPPTINADRRWGLFVAGDVRFGSENLVQDGQSTDTRNSGFTAGVDYRIQDKSYVGLAISYAHGSFTTHDLSDVQGNSYTLSLYGTNTFLKSAYLDGFISAGFHTFDNERSLTLGGGDFRMASASPTALHFSGEAETGYDFTHGAWKFGPFTGFKTSYIRMNSYDESGAGNFNLGVDDHNAFSAIGSVGAGVSRHFAMSNGGNILPALRISFNHEFGDTSPSVTSHFLVAPNQSFATEGVRRGRNWLSLSPSMTAALPNNWVFQAQYQRSFFRDNEVDNVFTIGARYMW